MSEPTAERWLPVPGYEGLYEVSDLGRVWSISRRDRFDRKWGGYPLRPYIGGNGYVMVALTRDGKTRQATVHSLVAAAFIGPRPADQEVRHKDGDRARPWLSNLEYGTSSDNEHDKVRHGNHHYASRDSCSKGHEYTEANLSLRLNADGTVKQRICLQCRRDRTAAITAVKPPRSVVCGNCGTKFEVPQTVGKARKRYCSPECLKIAQKAQVAAAHHRATRCPNHLSTR